MKLTAAQWRARESGWLKCAAALLACGDPGTTKIEDAEDEYLIHVCNTNADKCRERYLQLESEPRQ